VDPAPDRALAHPATNSGLFLNADPSQLAGRYRFFASMEHPDTLLRPYLRTTYSVAISAGCSSCPGESNTRFVRGSRHDQGQRSSASTASSFLGPEGQEHPVSTARGVGGKLGDQAALTEARFTDHRPSAKLLVLTGNSEWASIL